MKVLDHESERLEDRWGVSALVAGNRAFCRLYHQVSVRRPPCLPTKGPAILICNHVSGLDPLLLQSCFKRLVIWMMAREYYEVKGLGWVFRAVQAIPVSRTGRDLAATRAGLRALQEGRILGVFPEGRIETSQALLPFQTGVALMAIKSNVPVFPAYLDGTQRGKEMVPAIAKPNRAVITFGPPVAFDRSSTARPALEAATEKMVQAVKALASSVGASV